MAKGHTRGIPRTVDLEGGGWTLSADPARGAAILTCQYEGKDVLRAAPTDWNVRPEIFKTGSFPLAPYSNRIANGRFEFDGQIISISRNHSGQEHPIHGCVWHQKWDVLSISENAVSMALDHRAEDGVWPWSARFEHRLELHESRLHMYLSIQNMDDRYMPAGLGFHPYFADFDRLSVQTDVTDVQPSGPDDLPLSASFDPAKLNLSAPRAVSDIITDNCYKGGHTNPRLYWTDRPWHAEIESSQTLPYCVIYSNPKDKDFCLEPVSHINNALGLYAANVDTGLGRLRRGEILESYMDIRIQPE